jgi:gamma-glutamyltranspeptidase/glutathione hydrolase
MLMLRDHGRLPLREVLEPAIHYARTRAPDAGACVASEIAGLAEVFRDEWPTSAPVWLPGGKGARRPGELFRNPDCAVLGGVLVDEAEAAGPDARRRSRRRAAPIQGFVAEAIDEFLRDACVIDATGGRRKGVLTGQDMATLARQWEAPVAVDHHGWTVWKCGAWTQGPVLLQVAADAEKWGRLYAMDPTGAAFVHLVAEALKRAFADREAYYGDPAISDVPMDTLLSRDHNGAAHRPRSAPRPASHDQRPGAIPGLRRRSRPSSPARHGATARGRCRRGRADDGAPGEPAGDTVHIDVVDRWGNMVSATPSGGWLKSNPVVPGLAFR